MESSGAVPPQRCSIPAPALTGWGSSLPHPTLLGVPKLSQGGWERGTPLPGKAGSAGWPESLKACGDAKEAAAEMAAS